MHWLYMLPNEGRLVMAQQQQQSGKAAMALGGILVIVWLSGLGAILAGMIAGILLVLGLMMTIERIPGFWSFACTGFGTLVVLFGTGWLSHLMIGTGTAIGMIALVTSLIGKVALIDHQRRLRGLA